jgi:hypothetical protein
MAQEVISDQYFSDNKKAPGEDQIHVEFHKHLGPKTRKLFLDIVNSTWTTQALVKWKDTNVVAILKLDKDPTCPGSYRPIALTCSSAKVAEKMVNLRLDNFLKSNYIISSDQAGF